MVLLEREHVRVMAGLRVGHESQDKAESATELPGSLRADRECTMSYLGHRQWSPTLAGGPGAGHRVCPRAISPPPLSVHEPHRSPVHLDAVFGGEG